jgi:hypothetical protein
VKSVYFPHCSIGEAECHSNSIGRSGERLKFGEFELAPDARSLWRRGEQVRVGSRALDILIALASRPGQIVSKDDLTNRPMTAGGRLISVTVAAGGLPCRIARCSVAMPSTFQAALPLSSM